MVELEAASVLAQNLEDLVAQLSSKGVEGDIEEVVVLKNGLDRLRLYLNGIEKQSPISPFVLLQDINSVRQIMDLPVLTEYDLFDPPLNLETSQQELRALEFVDEKRRNVLFHLRKRFRKSLVTWLKNPNDEQALAVMSDLMSHLQRVSGPDVFKQLWWVAAGFVESIKNGDIEAGPKVKAQFAQLDFEMSRMRDDNAGSIASSPPDNLLRHMLFYIGRASSTVEDESKFSEKANQIKLTLGLDKWFSYDFTEIQESEYRQLETEISRFSEAVGEKIISQLENNIDLYFSGDIDAESTTQFFEQLDQLEQTTEEHQLEEFAPFVSALCRATKHVSPNTDSLLESGADIKIASAVLLFKESLSGDFSLSNEWEKSIKNRTAELTALVETGDDFQSEFGEDIQLAQIEYINARLTVFKELESHVSKIEEILTTSDLEGAQITRIQDLLSHISSWFYMINAQSVSELCTETSTRLEMLAQPTIAISVSDSERLVFVIASISVCIEMLERDQNQYDGIVSRARQMLQGIAERPESAHSSQSQMDAGELIEDEPDTDSVASSQQVGQDMDDVAQPQTGSTQALLDQLDTMRKEIGQSDSNSKLLHLSLLFSSLEDNAQTEQHSQSSKLAAIGSELSTRIAEKDLRYSDEAADYIGRLCRQLRQLENEQYDTGSVNVDEWIAAYELLVSQQDEIQDELDTDLDTNLDIDLETDFDTESEEQVDDDLAATEKITYSIDDEKLKEIFIDELGQYVSELDQITESLNVTDDDQSLSALTKDQSENVTRIVHTLTGVFNNLGLGEFGDILEKMESVTTMEINDHQTLQDYCQCLGQFRIQLDDLKDEIGLSHIISEDKRDKLEALSNQFNRIQNTIVKQAIPFDMDSLDSDTEFETRQVEEDFSIDLDSEHHAEDEFDEEIRQIFIEESESLLSRINRELTNWRNEGVNDEILASVRREFHTLKGSAAATGFDEISTLSHAVESLLEKENEDMSEDDSGLLNLLEEMHDGLAAELGFIPGADKDHMRSLISMVELLLPASGESGHQEMGQAEEEQAVELEQDLVEQPELMLDENLSHDQRKESDEREQIADGVGFEEESDDTAVEDMDPLVGDSGDDDDSVESDLAMDDSTGTALDAAVVEDDNTEEADPSVVTLVSNQHAASMEVDAVQESEAYQPEDSDFKPTKSEASGFTLPTPTMATETGLGSLRIESKKLSDLLNFSGELGLTRTQLKNILEDTRNELDALREIMKTIRSGLRDLEFEADSQMRAMPMNQEQSNEDESFDPLQLDRYSKLQARAREVNQQVDLLSRVERQLSDRASDMGGALIQQLHLGEQLQEGLISTRMVSVNDYLPRIRQLIRETSRRSNKTVNFTTTGGDIEVDRQVMDAMIAPLEHMIRNSMVHGIESESERKDMNKSAQGNIVLNVNQQGSELLVEYSDDGKGIDKEKLAQHAVETGLVENIEQIDDTQLLRIISEPGFSTAETVTMDSGRGVGMDVVAQAVRSLGGSMSLSNELNQGATFRFRLPVTMTISQALLVRVGVFRFAILSRTIDRVMRIKEGEVVVENEAEFILVENLKVPIINLTERMGEVSMSTAELYRSLVLVRVAENIIAFQVDQFEENAEIVTKVAGTQLTSVDGITGVTVLADTSIVLILNPAEFVNRKVTSLLESQTEPIEQPETPQPDSAVVHQDLDIADVINTVMVVDDSLVVRKIMQRDLEGMGLNVVLATDGLNALDVLAQNRVDFALVDLEMPKMNGYELLAKLRENSEFERLPIIIITSRSGELHRERAINLKADEYITKPYDIEKLQEMMKSIALNKTAKH